MKPQPSVITRRTMATLAMTMMPLTNADSFMPRMSSRLSMSTMKSAGRFMMPWAMTLPWVSVSVWNGEWLHAKGTFGEPGRNSSSLLRYSLQAMETVAAPTAYSSTRSQPMIQATSSPMVAYEYVYALPAMGIIEANSA